MSITPAKLSQNMDTSVGFGSHPDKVNELIETSAVGCRPRNMSARVATDSH